MSNISAILFTLALLAVNAFFVASEFSLISSRRDRLSAMVASGNRSAKTVLNATEHLSIQLAGAQFGITIASLLLGKVGEPAIAHLIETPMDALNVPPALLHPIGFALALLLVTFLHIILGEMVPKNIALVGPERVACILIPIHTWFVRLTRPFIAFFNWAARMSLKIFGVEQKDELDDTVSSSQLTTMLDDSVQEGLLDEEEHERLNKVLSSSHRMLSEVIIPLDQLRTIDFGNQGPLVRDIEQAMAETGYSRFPIVDQKSNYVGYVHIKDILDVLVDPQLSESTTLPLDLIHPFVTVSTSAHFDEAMKEMRQNVSHMAIVVDSLDNPTGVLTLEDLLEEFVGTVHDWTHED